MEIEIWDTPFLEFLPEFFTAYLLINIQKKTAIIDVLKPKTRN